MTAPACRGIPGAGVTSKLFGVARGVASVVGAVPAAEGFYTATGCVVGGLSISPGLGENVAQLILTGTSDIPLDLFAITRFAPDFNEQELVAACVDAYAHHYSEDYAALG